MSKEIKTIGIVGAGQMGSGIAGIAIEAGYNVFIYDEKPGVVGAVTERYKHLWRRIAGQQDYCANISEFERWVQEYVDFRFNRLNEVVSLGDFNSTDFIIEAVVEDSEVKKRIFSELDDIAPRHCIFTSNTSSILIKELSQAVRRKDRFMGMHFMNPPHVLTLLEVVRGPATSEETFSAVMSVAARMRRGLIVESPDIRGFATNGTTLAFINSAALLVERMMEAGMGWGEACDLIDGVFEGKVRTGGEPMGMLSLADHIGIDTCVHILNEMARSDPHYHPCRILEKLAKEGRLGMKSGEGFFRYQ